MWLILSNFERCSSCNLKSINIEEINTYLWTLLIEITVFLKRDFRIPFGRIFEFLPFSVKRSNTTQLPFLIVINCFMSFLYLNMNRKELIENMKFLWVPNIIINSTTCRSRINLKNQNWNPNNPRTNQSSKTPIVHANCS